MSQGRRGIWNGRGKQMHRLILAYLLLLASPCMSFLPNFWSRVLTLSWDSYTHQYITEQAIINVTMETLTCSKKQGNQAEDWTRLGRGFWRAVGEVVKSNAAMDFLSSTRSDPVYHFDSERVDSAMLMLRQFWAQTLLSVQAKEYQSARHSLGQLFHSLQDFYSHSNWVEMGQRSIYLHLLQPEKPAIPVAEGKCSHGGILDSSRHMGAKGGINKDSTSPLFSPHHYLHVEAATLATEATLTVLRDLRDTVGPKTFLRLFSMRQAPALVFVIDTTGSMFEEITAARLRAHSIIQSRAASTEQPGTYVLVPFHDPAVGPVYETDDPNQFMQHMENLMALGGGDEPEMCLSAIQLALTQSPPLSEIFVFTDASPKDFHLFDAVKALTLEKQSKVTFLLTKDPNYTTESRKRRRRKKRSREPLSPDRFSLYSALSSMSGGLTIFTTNSDIHKVSAIVEDNTASDKLRLNSGFIAPSGDSTVDFLYYFAAVTNDTHPGLARMEGSPIAGLSAFLVLAVTGLAPDEEASFSHVTLLGPEGEKFQEVRLKASSSSSSSSLYSVEELVGWVDSVPRAPFYVCLTGQDSRGNKLERVSTEMVQPTHVQIQVLSAPHLVPGHSTVVNFDILNHGPARLFNLTAGDDRGYLHSNGPHSFHVAEQRSFRAQVDLHIPATAQAGVTVTLTLTVRALDSQDSNYAVTYLSVVPLDLDMSPPSCFVAERQTTCPSACNDSTWTVSLVVSDRGHSGLSTLLLQKGEGILTSLHNPPPREDSLEEDQPSPKQQNVHKDKTRSGDQHQQIRIKKGDPPLNLSEWVLDSSEPLWLSYTSCCCSAQAELLIWDLAGNMKRCHIISSQQSQQENRSTEISGSGQIRLLGILLFGLLWSSLS
ncbi:von Willebrand factor A domain-containing protein 7 Protein G7c Precursor [Channa argus]|uniref:von Willebrand factor A domain-containing protein 7 Protein G7c n=1 Tax=Channa argus TaxID=215402 RepID=A0A6G1PS19_CHAAH|nr:von Willebrand factor A domain-containing protein 7 Protein G7c Precursor [Channa argus]